MPEWPYISEDQDLPDFQWPMRSEPLWITAGDSIDFIKFFSAFPASGGWTLKYSLRGVPGSVIDFGSQPASDGNGLECIVAPAVTLTWAPGKYSIQGRAINAGTGETHTVYTGFFEVKPSLVAGKDVDLRSHAQKCLDNIEAVLEGRATQDVLESKIEGTAIMRIPVPDLLLFRDRYKAEVRSQERMAKAKDGRATGRNVLARFVPPGR